MNIFKNFIKFSENGDGLGISKLNGFPSRKTFEEAIDKLSALRVPGGNQVDGLPPARHTESQCFWKGLARPDLWCVTCILQFNWYFAFELLVLLHSKSPNHVEVQFPVSISFGARPKSSFEQEPLFSKMLIFWWIFSKFSENFQEIAIFRQFQKWIAS